MRLLRWLFGKRTPKTNADANDSVTVRVRYKLYADHVDLAGRNIFGLVGASREATKEFFPFLVNPTAMGERDFDSDEVTAMIGEIADEVHEFQNAWQGGARIKRLLLRNNKVIELQLGN